jgi:DNA polymerase-3 subunit delta
LVFGPDQGLVRERAERLAKTVVPDLADAFRVAELDETALSSDGARLFDEAAAISMLGGRRVVRVRSAGNALAKLFESFLDDPKGDALVVVESGDLARSASLRKVFEEADNAAAIQCYADSPQALSIVVRNALKADGLAIDGDALEAAVSRLGGDRGIARREVEKLALYARGQTRIGVEDIRAIMEDEAEARGEDVCDAAGEGDLQRLDLALERIKSADLSAIGILRTALAHFQKLLLAKTEMERGESVDSVMRRLRPPVHFARTASFKAQVSRWTAERLAEALDLLFETEALCKTTGIPAEVVCARSLFTVAAMARGR